ncbi:hypothetical protein [Halorubrum ezzemoulense]|uniref:hypothetical protein n=1 Tax=Halorubrum ezzemoulense TaxID=337243 RepID=UPI00232EBB57|nr:hypothetical protein [Halorubrum ezzemoulense]MDB9255679.1 hypothetical protein [Halorubrum ezzemoulense]MDB9276390.1 hypothetical protein [Halorubrum ezzemoulense]
MREGDEGGDTATIQAKYGADARDPLEFMRVSPVRMLDDDNGADAEPEGATGFDRFTARFIDRSQQVFYSQGGEQYGHSVENGEVASLASSTVKSYHRFSGGPQSIVSNRLINIKYIYFYIHFPDGPS